MGFVSAIKSFKTIVKTIFQHCCVCESITFQDSYLCKRCLKQIMVKNIQVDKTILSEKIPHSYCNIMGDYSSSAVKKWVKTLKNSGINSDFKIIANQLIQIRAKTKDYHRLPSLPVFIVPSPSRTQNPLDHSYGLALALSQETGWEVFNILEFEGHERQQKLNSIKERKLRIFSIKDLHQKDLIELSQGVILFVDDVITTGNTALAAWKALNKPLFFEVWAVAYQKKRISSNGIPFLKNESDFHHPEL